MRSLIIVVALVVLAISVGVKADTVSLTLDSSEVGTHLAEGTRVPSDLTSGVPQYNRTEVFVGWNGSGSLLSLRSVFGFDINPLYSLIPAGSRIDGVSLDFTAHETDGTSVKGIELWLSAIQNVDESTFDFDTYGVDGPTGYVAGASTGLGAQLSSDATVFTSDATTKITLNDTTGDFLTTFRAAYNASDSIYTVVLTSLTNEAESHEGLLRIYSDDQSSSTQRPHLNIEYTPIQQIGASDFADNTMLLDFESSPNGFLDPTADNPSTNSLFTSNGILQVTGSAPVAANDLQNQNSINGKGLYFDGERFIILPRNDDPFDNNAYGFNNNTSFDIEFASEWNQIGVTFIDQTAQTMTFSFYRDGNLIASYDLAVALTTTTEGNQLYALETPFFFDRVVIDGSNSADGWGLGEIRVGVIPEPTSLALLTLAAAPLLRRRRR